MTKRTEADIERDLEELPMMSIPLDAAVILICDHLDIDPLEAVRAIMDIPTNPSEYNDMCTAHGKSDMMLIQDIIWDAVDSSTYLPHLEQALILAEELNDL